MTHIVNKLIYFGAYIVHTSVSNWIQLASNSE
jgi:hypothetical protein